MVAVKLGAAAVHKVVDNQQWAISGACVTKQQQTDQILLNHLAVDFKQHTQFAARQQDPDTLRYKQHAASKM
jgi:hypothetical protein